MQVTVSSDRASAGRAAARLGAERLRGALGARGSARLVVATGVSQFDVLDALVGEPDVAWEHVTVFHLDEYVGLPLTHPASFRAYLWNRFHRRLPRPLQAFHYIAGEADPAGECARLGALIRSQPIDVCFAGIGENGHLAFNDPPADFATEQPFLVVSLDEACRRQQLGEGWFPSLADVPRQAISMSVRQIMTSACVVVAAPDRRKAEAVQRSLEGPVSPAVPASILQHHPDAHLFLDPPAASLLAASAQPASP